VTGSTCLYSFIPLAGHLDDRVWAGCLAIRNGRLTATLTGQTRPLASVHVQVGVKPDMLRRSRDIGGRADLPPALSDS
jgi:hypothetical protein